MCDSVNSDPAHAKCALLGLIVVSLQHDEWSRLSALWPWHRSSVHPNRLRRVHCCTSKPRKQAEKSISTVSTLITIIILFIIIRPISTTYIIFVAVVMLIIIIIMIFMIFNNNNNHCNNNNRRKNKKILLIIIRRRRRSRIIIVDTTFWKHFWLFTSLLMRK